MSILARTNDALNINLPQGEGRLSVHGSDWLWTVTAIMALCFITYFALSFKPPHGEKIFHYMFTGALLVGAISYFAMASDLGFLVIKAANQTSRGATRQIFYAKYIYWVISFPTVIISLGLLSGVSWATIVFNVFLSWIWVISYLISAFVNTNYKWGFFTFGTISWLCFNTTMLTSGLKSARRVDASRDYLMVTSWVSLLWLLYPIAFGLSDGGNRIKVTAGFIFFGILDVLMIPLISVVWLVLSRKWDYGKLNLHFTQYGRVAKGADQVEKEPPSGSGGVTGEQAA